MANKLKLHAIGYDLSKDVDDANIDAAIAVGYRHFVVSKQTQKKLSQALEKANISLEDVFITAKITNEVTTVEQLKDEYQILCNSINVSNIDMYLIPDRRDAEQNKLLWNSLEKLYEQKKVQAIGVANFEIKALDDLLETANIAPMMNYFEIHPLNQEWDLHEYCWNFDIALMTNGLFMTPEHLNNAVLQKIAKKHNKTVQQILIKWSLQRGIFTVVKEENKEKLESCFKSRDFELSNIDMEKIADINSETKFKQN